MQKLHVLWFYMEKQILLQEMVCVCVWERGGGWRSPYPPFSTALPCMSQYPVKVFYLLSRFEALYKLTRYRLVPKRFTDLNIS